MANNKSSCESKMDNTPPHTHPQLSVHTKILHDIRNMRRLSKEQIASIRIMSAEEKIEIILTYDYVIESWTDFIENM